MVDVFDETRVGCWQENWAVGCGFVLNDFAHKIGEVFMGVEVFGIAKVVEVCQNGGGSGDGEMAEHDFLTSWAIKCVCVTNCVEDMLGVDV